MKDEDFCESPDGERDNEMGPVERRETEIKAQQERGDAGDEEKGQLDGAHDPAVKADEAVDQALEIDNDLR